MRNSFENWKGILIAHKNPLQNLTWLLIIIFSPLSSPYPLKKKFIIYYEYILINSAILMWKNMDFFNSIAKRLNHFQNKRKKN